ncbi:MAG: glycosyltransferase family 4 protein [Cellulomonadaceae bacterium]
MTTILCAHPSADVYGSDLQLVETVRAVHAAGWRVAVTLPSDGPLVPLLRTAGAAVVVEPFPVLRKALLRPRGLAGLAAQLPRATAHQAAVLRRVRPDVVLVNTLTIPTWVAAARQAGIPVVCHVHEAEDAVGSALRRALAAPLLLADRVVVNSRASRDVLVDAVPALTGRTEVVHNGLEDPPAPPAPPRHREPRGPARLVVVGRLSPRKGIDVALDAAAELRRAGRDVTVDVAGTAFTGYDWYEKQLRERAQRPDLRGAVRLHGYVHPTWDLLAEADVVLVPSRAEPFGNTAVEALLARRPLVASRVQGLSEIVREGVTGLLVRAGDPHALAAAVGDLLDDPARATRLAEAGRADATARFGITRYADTMVDALGRALRTPRLDVLLSSPRPLPTTNPYTIMLADHLADREDLTVQYFSWRRALLGRYDVFHVHWPEILVSGHSELKKLVRQAFTAAFLVRMQARRTAVVRSVHNIDLPDGISRRERLLLAWMDRRTDVRVVLNTHTPVPQGARTTLAAHGHYVDWFADYPRRDPVPGRVTYFGSIRRYKSVDRLLAAFQETAATEPDLTLTLSGRPSSHELTAMVHAAEAADPRISAHLDFVDDAELTAQVTEATLVVLPYRHMHNSGATLAALSIGRPVLVPDTPVNAELAEEVGPGWVHTFAGELTGEDIRKALAACAGPDSRPDLSARDWPSGVDAHARAYHEAAAVRGPRRRCTAGAAA